MPTVQETIAHLRDARNYEIELPKGVAVGLLVGIEDALDALSHLEKRAKTKKDKSSLGMMRYHLEGPRDRLLRVVTGEWEREKKAYEEGKMK